MSADGAQGIADEDDAHVMEADDVAELDKQALQALDREQASVVVDIESYVPRITNDRQWVISELDLGKLRLEFNTGVYST